MNVMNYFHKFLTGASDICVHDSAVELLKFIQWGGSAPPTPRWGSAPNPGLVRLQKFFSCLNILIM